MAIATNKFQKGYSIDVNNLDINNEVYTNAENIRLQSKDGNLLAITNTQGSLLRASIPDTNPIYKIEIDEKTFVIPVTATLNITWASGNHIFNYTFTQETTPQKFTEDLKAISAIALPINLGFFDIQYNKKYIVLVGLDQAVTISGLPTGVTLTTLVPTQTGLNIIGMIGINNTIVLFTTNNTQNPDSTTISSYGQIWAIEFNELTNEIKDIGTNNFLVPSKHLKYNEKLDLTSFRRISGEGRYEHLKAAKVYFTDYYNNLRFFNIAKSNNFATPPEILQVNPLNIKSVPLITSIQDGGFIPNGAIQYFYQLLTDDGLVTFFSNPSDIMFLTDKPLNSSFQSYQGGTRGFSSGKSITLTINDLDLRYSIVKVGYLLYEDKDNPIVRTFFEGSVPPTGTITLIHDYRVDNEITLSLAEYTALFGSYDICKGLETKKNILLAYNTKTRPFDVKFDARAYRFNVGRQAPLFQFSDVVGAKNLIFGYAPVNANTTLDYGATTASWTDIPETDDCINPYNFEDPNLNKWGRTTGSDWMYRSQFKYQTDGTTLGGEGPNIKYRFIEASQEYMDVKQIQPTSPFGTNYPYLSDYGVGTTQFDATEFSSMKNVYRSSYNMSFARGEVYRMALVFHGTSSQNSFVKWVGDIKFPGSLEYLANAVANAEYFTNYDKQGLVGPPQAYLNGEYTFTQQIGIEFTLDTSTAEFQAIKDQITGWSFVRLERTSKDKTRLGVGLVNTTTFELYGSPQINVIDNSEINNTYMKYDNDNPSLITFDNPNFQFDIDYNYTSSDYLKIVNFTDTRPSTTLSAHFFLDAWYEKQSIQVAAIQPNNDSRIPIGRLWAVPRSTTGNYVPAEPPGLPARYINMTYACGSNDDEFRGAGNKTTLLACGIFNNTPLMYNYNLPYGFTSTNSVLAQNGKVKILCSYERYLDNQYNGATYVSRLGQDYIYGGETILYDGTTTPVVTQCYAGDVYTMMYDQVKIEKNWSTAQSGYNNDGGSPLILLGQTFPTEVSGNIHLRQGWHFANKDYPATTTSSAGQGGPFDDGNNVYDEYILNTAYNQQQTSKKFFSKPFNYTPINEQPHRIWASQRKFDGEFIEAWMDTKPNDFIDVEGTFGPLSRVIMNGDKVTFYQQRAIGTVDVEEKQVLSNVDGTATTIGTGTVLQRYDYSSKNTGAFHQFGLVKTPLGIYHFDIYERKLFRLGQGLEPLTDIKGISTWTNQHLTYNIKDKDLTTKPNPRGVVLGYDPRYNTIYCTFQDSSNNTGEVSVFRTLTYNELLDCFESLNWSTNIEQPSQYYQTKTRMLAVPTNNLGTQHTLHELNVGLFNVYFNDNTAKPSSFSIVVNAQDPSKVVKRWDIFSAITQVLDSNGLDVPLETISTIRFRDDYQDTGVITLTPQNNFRRVFRTWRFNKIWTNGTNNPRFRDRYMIIDITFVNSASINRKLIVYGTETTFVQQPF